MTSPYSWESGRYNEEERGFLQIGEGMSVPLLATWPAMEEREKEGHLMRKSVESWRKLEFGRKSKLVEEGRKKEKKEKGKEFINEDIFLVSKNGNI